MLEVAVASAFIFAVVILVILAFSGDENDGLHHPRPSDENWRHW